MCSFITQHNTTDVAILEKIVRGTSHHHPYIQKDMVQRLLFHLVGCSNGQGSVLLGSHRRGQALLELWQWWMALSMQYPGMQYPGIFFLSEADWEDRQSFVSLTFSLVRVQCFLGPKCIHEAAPRMKNNPFIGRAKRKKCSKTQKKKKIQVFTGVGSTAGGCLTTRTQTLLWQPWKQGKTLHEKNIHYTQETLSLCSGLIPLQVRN